MKRKFLVLAVLAGVSILHTGCFILTSTPSTPSTTTTTTTTTTPTPTVDYAPKNIRSGAYIAFTGSQGSDIKIVFETNNVASIPSSSASGGRINAAYYRYDGFNLASLTYNYSPNGGMSAQYKTELQFTSQTGGVITFLDTNTKASFTYRP